VTVVVSLQGKQRLACHNRNEKDWEPKNIWGCKMGWDHKIKAPLFALHAYPADVTWAHFSWGLPFLCNETRLYSLTKQSTFNRKKKK